MDLINFLLEMQDLSYRDFSARLMPTIPKNSIIGIRVPLLRKFAKCYSKNDNAIDFMNTLPHTYFEENNLHAFLIENINDFEVALKRTAEFLPFIDNWATCDSFCPKVFKKNTGVLVEVIKQWLKSDHVYTVRYAIGLLMKLYLDENFNASYPLLVSEVMSDEYYVKMMIAWYFATGLAKQYDDFVFYLENNILDKWTHNKTIQKACESYRISGQTKEYLKTLRRT